jgi:hypothetical protein
LTACFSLNPAVLLQAYGLKRLARGLASSRQGARQGFAAALAATLAHSAAAAAAAASQKGGKKGAPAAGVSTPLQAPFVSAAGVLGLLDGCLEVTGSMKGSVSDQAALSPVGCCSGMNLANIVVAATLFSLL